MRLIKKYKLKKAIQKARNAKIQEIKKQNFEAASIERDKEKHLQKELEKLQFENKRWVKLEIAIKPLFQIRLPIKEFHAFYIQEKQDSIPCRCEGYPYSVWLNIYLQAMFAEDSRIKNLWELSRIRKQKIIEEATEYYIIQLLMSIFSKRSQKRKYILTRNNIMPLTDSNIFFDLFGKSISTRKVFGDNDFDRDVNFKFARDRNNNILGLYEAFEYEFPYKCQLNKEGSTFVFSTPFMDLRFVVLCHNLAVPLPMDFSRYYLGFKKNSGRDVYLRMHLSIKWISFISPRNWSCAKLIKSIERETEENFTSKAYFKKLDWESIRIQSKIFENLMRNRSSKD